MIKTLHISQLKHCTKQDWSQDWSQDVFKTGLNTGLKMSQDLQDVLEDILRRLETFLLTAYVRAGSEHIGECWCHYV